MNNDIVIITKIETIIIPNKTIITIIKINGINRPNNYNNIIIIVNNNKNN